jgi:hypothetical protein
VRRGWECGRAVRRSLRAPPPPSLSPWAANPPAAGYTHAPKLARCNRAWARGRQRAEGHVARAELSTRVGCVAKPLSGSDRLWPV